MSRASTRKLGVLATTLVALVGGLFAAAPVAMVTAPGSAAAARATPPRAAGYFKTRPVGAWRRLPSGSTCSGRVRHSSWEPRRHNYGPNHRMPGVRRVHRAFRARPVAADGAYARRWDSWLLQRVTGHYEGTTDQIFQWAACKWGISDNVLRAVAYAESTWYQYEVYPSGRCVYQFSCGDLVEDATSATDVFCTYISGFGHNYEADYGDGKCPKTFGIVGVMSWEDPSWGRMPKNQNGTFPFNRNSTAFAVDYVASQLRGCYEGWEFWLDDTGTRDYSSGKLWGCVGAWYAGEWRSPDAMRYIREVRGYLADRIWRKPGFSKDRPGCDPTYGCPRGS